MLRTFAFALLVGTVVAAHASFEMMLLPGADGRIYRYDPINNITLGSYRTLSSMTMVTADLNGIAFSSHTGGFGFLSHDYSTGVPTGSLFGLTASIASQLVNGSLYVMTTTEVWKFNATTGALQGTYGSGGATTFRTMANFANRMIVIGTNAGGQITYQTFDMTTLASSGTTTLATTVFAGSTMGKAAALRNERTNANLAAYTYRDSSGNLTVGRFAINNDGTIPMSTTYTTALSGYSVTNFMPALMAGHNTVYAYGQDVTVGTDARIVTYELNTSLLANTSWTFAAGGGFRSFAHPYQGAILVAPEPGTMIGLGLGLAAILKRRRKSSAV
jgi:hypothetical protein